MKKKSLSGQIEWDTNGPALRFVIPFIYMVVQLRTFRHVDRDIFKERYSLTDSEFDDLVGRAEEFANEINTSEAIAVQKVLDVVMASCKDTIKLYEKRLI